MNNGGTEREQELSDQLLAGHAREHDLGAQVTAGQGREHDLVKEVAAARVEVEAARKESERQNKAMRRSNRLLLAAIVVASLLTGALLWVAVQNRVLIQEMLQVADQIEECTTESTDPADPHECFANAQKRAASRGRDIVCAIDPEADIPGGCP